MKQKVKLPKIKVPHFHKPNKQELQLFTRKFIATTLSLLVSAIVYYCILQVVLQFALATIAESMTAVDINANMIYIVLISTTTMSLMTVLLLKLPVYSTIYKFFSKLLRGEMNEKG
jgi:hypothetical protein